MAKAKRKKRVAVTRKPPTHAGYSSASKIFVSKPIDLAGLVADFQRADIQFHGVDHAEASFEARVFIDNPHAGAETELIPTNGFVGTFHIFGHGGCFGDVGHCEVRGAPRGYDPRPAHPLTPVQKNVIATDAIRSLVSAGKKTVQIVVVPIVTSLTEKCSAENVLKFEKISLVTYA